MEFTNQEKLEEVKRILRERIEGAGTLELLKDLIGSVAWKKLMNLFAPELQAEADKCDIESQESLDRKAKLLALKKEKDIF